MRIPKLTQIQIESWVARHFEYKKRKGGDEILICNPFVQDDKFKFNISTTAKQSKNSKHSNYWVHDWRPSAQQYNSSFIKFVQRYKGLSFNDAIKDVCGDGIDLKSILEVYQIEPKEIKTEINIQLPDAALPITDTKNQKPRELALRYLKSRGITYEDAKSFRLYYTPTMVIFPYLEYDEIVYWQGRNFSPFIKQFEFPDTRDTGIGKSSFIYGFDNAEPGHPIFLAEAIFGALTIGPGGVATGGATMSEMQRRKIQALNPCEIILAPDNDEEGRASISKNYKLLSPYFTMKYVVPPPDYKDWNEFVQKRKDKQIALSEIRDYIRNNIKPLTLASVIKFRMNQSL